ncbi:MAG: glycosyltransferase family 4 protein [Pseudomonadota bacterium]
MRIEVVSFTGTSGLADYAVSLAGRLQKHAHTTLVTADSLPKFFDSMGFTVERVFRRSRHYPMDVVRFLMGVVRRRPDVIVLQGPLKFPWFDGMIVRLIRLAGIRTAITVHDLLPHYPRWWSAVEYGFYYRSFSKVIVHSEAAHQGVKGLGVASPILVVPHGAYDIFCLSGVSRKDARRRIGVNDDEFVVLFFGHLEPRKGLVEFIEAARLLQAVPRLKFVIAGGNDMARHGAEYEAVLESAKMMGNVLVRDARIPFEEVENYFRASDLVVLPYREGTTSGVLKLAIAFEVPIIASRVGDLPEQVPPSGGVLIDAGDGMATALAEAVVDISTSPQRYRDGMRLAAQACDWGPIAKDYYEFLLAKGQTCLNS